MVSRYFILLCFFLGVALVSGESLPEMSLMTTGWKSFDVVPKDLQPKGTQPPYYKPTDAQSSNFAQLLYLASVGFGTPAQDATILFDTGSANLWVFGSECNDEGCAGKEKFNTTDSSTFTNQGKPLSLIYGCHAEFIGTLGVDYVTYGDFIVKDTFGVMTKVDPEFSGSHFSGICGMGATQHGADDVTTPLVTMVKQGRISNESFSLYLSRNQEGAGSRITFGGVNPNFYHGDMKYFSNVGASDNFWAVNMQTVMVGDQKVPQDGETLTVIDSGTMVIAFPESMITPVVDMIGHVEPNCSNVDQLPQLKFTFEDTEFVLEGSDYVTVFEIDGQMQCTLPLVGAEEDFMILGVMFLRRNYAHFDLENNRIGFASSI